MTQHIALPLWAFLLLCALATLAILDRFLAPGIRWFIRRRSTRLIEEVNTHLPFELPTFKLTKRQVLIDRLLYDAKVQEAVRTHAQTTGASHDEMMARVERYAQEIVPAFNAYLYFRLGYWAARRIARLLYRVRLGYADEEGLASIPHGATVVFVMNHRSNMDYILVGYLAARRAALSYAVGEWARIWPLQTLIRSMGAYFVRRNSRDELYRRVLERYVAMAAAAGVTQAVYPEGGLSRDGHLRPPKLGLLDYLLRGFDPKGERDLVFIPVGINYDRTLEDRTLLRELEPGTERPSGAVAIENTIRFVLHNLRLMLLNEWHRFGYACVNFGSPISMRAYLARHQLDLNALDKEQRFARVEALGQELMKSIGAVIPVLPVSLVATVFVDEPELMLSELDLKARVHDLMDRLAESGAHVYVPRRDADYAITVGLRMLTLRHLVLKANGLYMAAPGDHAVLQYYANSIEHLLPAREIQANFA